MSSKAQRRCRRPARGRSAAARDARRPASSPCPSCRASAPRRGDDARGDAVALLERRDRRAHLLDHGVIGRRATRRGRHSGRPGSRRHAAARGSPRPRGARRSRGTDAEPDELGRAAADIEDQRMRHLADRAAARSRRRRAAPPRSLEMISMRDAGLARGRGRGTRRNWRRGGRPRSRHSAPGDAPLRAILPAQMRSAAMRARHRRLGEHAARRQPLAQPHDAREGVDDAEPLAARRRATSSRQLLVPRSSAA